jgi:hypothetical protein
VLLSLRSFQLCRFICERPIQFFSPLPVVFSTWPRLL